MADQIAEIKSKIDIVSLINGYVPLQKSGRNFKANCPFHAEKTPSFMVSQELQIFKCFGCGESGDAFSFLQKYEGMDFYEALQFLAEKAGVKLERDFSQGRSEKEKYYKANLLAAQFYQYILLKHGLGKKALGYLQKERGLTLATIKEFGLGFAPDKSDALFSFLKNKKGISSQDLVTAGLVVQRGRDFFDRFRGRVIFPIFDHRGNAVALAGRVLPGAKEDLAKYINSPETPVYIKGDVLYGLNLTKGEIKRLKKAVVVEGELDLLSTWQTGVKNVVAIKGTALTPSQARLLSRLGEEVLLALDKDAAGALAARRGIGIAQAAGLAVKVIKMGQFKDPDEFARADPSGFKKSVLGAVSVWDFLVDLAFTQGDSQTGEGKRKINKELLPVLLAIEDKIVQAHYVALAAKRLGVAVETVSQEMDRVGEKTEKAAPGQVEAETTKTRRELLEESLLDLGFGSDPQYLLEPMIGKIIVTSLSQRLLAQFLEYQKSHPKFTPAEFKDFLPAELKDSFAELMLTQEETSDPQEVKREMDLIVREIKTLILKEALAKQAGLMKKAEKEKDRVGLEKAKQVFNTLSQKLKTLE
jgi:DNA primase